MRGQMITNPTTKERDMAKLIEVYEDAERFEVLERDGFSCRVCGRYTEAPPHHLVKRSQGGADIADNLITVCVECHRGIHDAVIALEPDAPR